VTKACFLLHPVQIFPYILGYWIRHSYHITPNKYWLNNCRLVNSGFVLMVNDDSYKVIGIRNIKIKMFDGVRILCDVRYIPNLRKNLISLGILDRNGFNFKSEGGVLKVSKGVMTVIKG